MSSVSIIIPVYREEKIINGLISHLETVFPDNKKEIIVSDGDSTGSTINRISSRNVIKLISPKGRANQMNFAASLAKNEILLFLHADSRLHENSFYLIVSSLKDKRIKAGAFDLKIDSNHPFLKLTSKTASLRSRITRIPYGDQGIFIKREVFNFIGGYSKIPLMEDIDLMQKLKKRDYKIIILTERIRTSSRRWNEQGVIYCSLRNIIISTLYYLGVKPEKLVKYY